MLTLMWAGSPLLLLTLVLLLLILVRLVRGVRMIPSGSLEEHYHMELPQPFSSSLLVGAVTPSVMITLLTNSRNDPLVLIARRSCSFMERPFIKQYFFFSSVSTYSGAYCTRWLNNMA
jgi:hypothetical protein